MDKVSAFDAEWIRQNDYRFLMSRVGCYMLCFFGTATTLFPSCEEWNTFFYALPLILYTYAIQVYLSPFLWVGENSRRMVSIYEKLRYVPVSKKEIVMVRIRYLKRFCIPTSVANLIAGQLGTLMAEKWSILSILYPLALNTIVFWLGIYLIVWPKHSRPAR